MNKKHAGVPLQKHARFAGPSATLEKIERMRSPSLSMLSPAVRLGYVTEMD